MYSYQDIFQDKQKILIVTAHPDDSIVSFGGLIHQLRKDGKEVTVVVVTNGARGSRDTTISETELAQTRVQEEAQALEILGVDRDHLHCLEYADGEVECQMTFIGQIARFIRQTKADIVCTHEPTLQYTTSGEGYYVQHRDHRKIGEGVIDAVYPFSRDRSFFTEQYSQGLEPHSVYEILLTDELKTNFIFDCTEHSSQKRQALLAHKSQFDETKVNHLLSTFTNESGVLEECFHYLKLVW